MEQRTPEWFVERMGKVTGSRIADVVARTKSGYGASRANYMAQLLVERLTLTPSESYINSAMQWGIDHEPLARAAYEFLYDRKVELVAFVEHPVINMAGCSPDGFVGDEGLVEFKCPNTATHIETLLTGKVDQKYIHQMQWQMACTDRRWCDFVSFDPRLPAKLQMWRKRVTRDDKVIEMLENETMKFLQDLDDKVEALNKLQEET